MTGDKYLSKLVTTLRNWWEEVLNYFIDRITNGFVEELNGALRIKIRGVPALLLVLRGLRTGTRAAAEEQEGALPSATLDVAACPQST
jgi:hypothetical protein